MINTRKSLHMVLRGVYIEKEVFFLPTLKFPFLRQAFSSGSDVFF